MPTFGWGYAQNPQGAIDLSHHLGSKNWGCQVCSLVDNIIIWQTMERRTVVPISHDALGLVSATNCCRC